MAKHTAWIVRAIALGLLSTAMGTAAHAEGEHIAVFTKNQTNPQFEVMRIGSGKAAANAGAVVSQFIPTKADSIPEQMAQLEDVIVRHPAGIVLVPVDNAAIGPAISAVNKAQIPIVDLNDKADTGNFVSFVGTSDRELAIQTARYLAKAMNGNGRVVIIEGIKGSRSSEDRLKGFRDALTEFPNIKIIASQPGNNQRVDAAGVMDNLLQSFPTIDGVLTINDSMAMGVVASLDAADRHALVASINGTREVAAAVGQGQVLVSAVSDGFAMGCIATEAMIRHLRGQPVPKEILLPSQMVEKSNYAQWTVRPETRTCPKWEDMVRSAS